MRAAKAQRNDSPDLGLFEEERETIYLRIPLWIS